MRQTKTLYLNPSVISSPYLIGKLFCVLVVLLVGWSEGNAQSVSLSTPLIEDYYRRKQVLGDLPSDFSFMVRPVNPNKVFADAPADAVLGEGFLKGDTSENTVVVPLPVGMNFQHNSSYPFGQNNGAMIPNRGFQFVLSGGAYLEIAKGLAMQFQPEIMVAQNKHFRGMPAENSTNWRDYYEYLNRIDRPERFGEAPFLHVYLGNSSLKYTFDNGLAVGVSNEYLWWGPSRQNSLMMSNNAPGFLHFTVNTTKPLQTQWGNFEGQVIAGKLENSNFPPPNSDLLVSGTTVYAPKRDRDWRYLAGVTITFQPKFIPGLFVGYSSTSQVYYNELDGLGDFLPMFNGRKRFADLDDPVRNKRHQLSSGHFRWLSQKGKFELYGEYGSNGNSKPFREFIVNPDLYRAYTVGFYKLISLRVPKQFIQVNVEHTQTGQTVRKAIRENKIWYTHDHVRHGYTNRGQILGYGHGSGSNSSFVEVSWVQNLDRLGIQFERIVNNNDSFYLHFEHIDGWDRYWVDLVPSLVFDRKIGDFLIASRFQYVNTLNYYWVLDRDPNDPMYRLQKGDDRKNFVGHIRVAYLF